VPHPDSVDQARAALAEHIGAYTLEPVLLPCCSGSAFELASPLLRVVSQQPAIHQLVHGTVACRCNSLNPANEAPQNDHLRLPCGLFLLALESNKLDCLEVDGEQPIVDRSRQITLVPPLLAKQFVQSDQQADVEYIEADVPTSCHRPHHPLRGRRSSSSTAVCSVRYIHHP